MINSRKFAIRPVFGLALVAMVPLVIWGRPVGRWLKAQYDGYRGSQITLTADPSTYQQLLQQIRQQQPKQQLTIAPSPPTHLSERIFQAAIAPDLLGRSSEFEPYTHNGKLACAVMVNRAIHPALGRSIGDNPLYVPSMVASLDRGQGQRLTQAQTQRGDLAISNGTDYANGLWHIGICMNEGCQMVLSNSPSAVKFNWLSDANFDGAFAHFPGETTFYRVLARP
ncbi:MAG: hypothetical protein VKJ24_06480 [Synechococcales bacterium]|nr:hypothetical protein [Synechococcales bacterium]